MLQAVVLLACYCEITEVVIGGRNGSSNKADYSIIGGGCDFGRLPGIRQLIQGIHSVHPVIHNQLFHCNLGPEPELCIVMIPIRVGSIIEREELEVPTVSWCSALALERECRGWGNL